MVTLSIVIAVILAKTGVLADILTATKELRIVGSFVAGIFFISVFTAAPALVVLGEIAEANSIFLVAFFGGLGALLGDLLIFRFMRNTVKNDIDFIIDKIKSGKVRKILDSKLLRWVTPVIGALIIASPLPDELGVTMLGLSHMKPRFFIPLSFALNFLGILLIAFMFKAW